MSIPIGSRLRALREERGISQEEMARSFGFNDRQTVSAIETGERRLTAEELVIAVQKLGASLEDFTDPFRLVGEGKFSWRQTNVGAERTSAYERSAGRWIAAFRAIAPEVGHKRPLLRQALTLTKGSSFEEAMAAGERFAADFELGDVPASRLADTIEQCLGILVLMVDTTEGVSGAACRLPELDVVLINRREVAGRRNFDLAHELFHILTWDVMPPDHIEEATETGKGRVEQLANSFASALLMPSAVLKRYGDWSGLGEIQLIKKLNETADALQVTASALKWRLVALGWLKPAVAKGISDSALRNNGRCAPAAAELPPLFSRPFMDVLARAVNVGRISVRRVASLLDLTVDDLADLFRVHGVEAQVDL